MFLLDTEFNHSNKGLVAEKITRPVPEDLIPRPRLRSLLDQSLTSCAATIICGRAGCGKTALAVDFSLSSGRSTAWYKVDSPEGDLRIFFQYLIASIQKQRPDFGTETLHQLVAEAEAEHVPVLAEALVYDLAEGDRTPLLIVVEDLHLICDADWLVPFFRRLLPLLPSEVHLLITSRTLPPAPLWRMRSKQTLMVVSEDTLAFTRSEAAQLFESYGLSVEQSSIALDHTHGRALALATFAASLGRRQNANITSDPERLGPLESAGAD